MKTLKKEYSHIIDTIEHRVIDIRHNIHEHPELSGGEKETKALVKHVLKQYGYEVKEYPSHYGITADLVTKEGAKMVAIRGDMDALPIVEKTGKPYASKIEGIMHACGHDAHTANLLGVAIGLKILSKEHDLPGNFRFIFQPSEESKEGGSVDMIADGVLNGVDMILGLHVYPYLPTGQIGYKYGVMMASADIFSIEVYGKSAHGARPHEGVDAILVTSMVVNSLNHIVSRRIDPLHPAVISLGTINGGRASNIICDDVVVTGTVRTINEAVRKNIPEMMEESIKGVCKAMGAEYKFDYQFGQPELINNDEIVDILIDESRAIIGHENCVNLVDPVMGGEDFSEYLKIVPGSFFRLGSANHEKGTDYSQHNAMFDVDDDALKVGMKVLGATAMEYLHSH
ncbi:MAG: amidohydrolase [Epsilonproteobacteria bacterium]|nr:amidohydrolase [Campylobacterota bacterium]